MLAQQHIHGSSTASSLLQTNHVPGRSHPNPSKLNLLIGSVRVVVFKSGGIQRSAHILKSKVNCATHLTPPRGTPDVAATQTSQPMPSQLARQPHCAKRPVQGRSDCALHQVFPAANSNCGETKSHHANLQGWTLTPAALSVAAQRLTCTLLSNSPFARSCLARCGRGGCKLPACLQPHAAVKPAGGPAQATSSTSARPANRPATAPTPSPAALKPAESHCFYCREQRDTLVLVIGMP